MLRLQSLEGKSRNRFQIGNVAAEILWSGERVYLLEDEEAASIPPPFLHSLRYVFRFTDTYKSSQFVDLQMEKRIAPISCGFSDSKADYLSPIGFSPTNVRNLQKAISNLSKVYPFSFLRVSSDLRDKVKSLTDDLRAAEEKSRVFFRSFIRL